MTSKRFKKLPTNTKTLKSLRNIKSFQIQKTFKQFLNKKR